MNHECWNAFTNLLSGRGQDPGEDLPGAELVVLEGDREVFRSALARHVRRDRDDPEVIWIRPLVVPAALQTGLPGFDVEAVRRRALHVVGARLDGEVLSLALASGQHARIEPARAHRLARLQDFDTWMTTLAAERRAEVEALDHD
ncbi:hypothetical protein [Amycolatopsis sp. cmx-4-83]|uniref:hypothetical protein n=1 Tax=Amycolatopsis sp. cmx-4-83 TaxID=2790940 RepID=UPI00397A62F3